MIFHLSLFILFLAAAISFVCWCHPPLLADDRCRADAFSLTSGSQLLPTPLHQNHPPSLAHSNNTICNREERTFQVESSLCGERKYIGEGCMATTIRSPKAQNGYNFLPPIYTQAAKPCGNSYSASFSDTLLPISPQ